MITGTGVGVMDAVGVGVTEAEGEGPETAVPLPVDRELLSLELCLPALPIENEHPVKERPRLKNRRGPKNFFATSNLRAALSAKNSYSLNDQLKFTGTQVRHF